MQVPYNKMHSAGNLILVVDQREKNLPPPAREKIRKLGNEKTGPGFDQMLWLSPPAMSLSVASYRIFNADGSEAEQCGNGALCLARYLAGKHEHEQEFILQSPVGPVTARVCPDGTVTVSMGVPEFAAHGSAGGNMIRVGDKNIEVSVLSLGNPHCVLLVDDVRVAPVDRLGPQIEHHERFPQGTNVGFMHIRDRQNIGLRVHERGVGETAACGTGACAAVVSGQRLGLLDEAVRVHLSGGQVVVSWRGGDDPVWLSGDAGLISEGMMDL